MCNFLALITNEDVMEYVTSSGMPTTLSLGCFEIFTVLPVLRFFENVCLVTTSLGSAIDDQLSRAAVPPAVESST